MTENRSTTEPRERSAEATKKRLVEAAIELFASRGLSGATIDAIAEAAGISRGSIFWHFGSKEGLMWAVVDALYMETGARIFDDAEGRTGIEAVDAAFAARCDQLRRQTQVARLAELLFAEALGPHQELAPGFAKFREEHIAVLRKWLVAGINAGEFREDLDVKTTADVLFAAMSGIASHWLLEQDSIDLEEAHRVLLQLIRRTPVEAANGPSQTNNRDPLSG